MDYRLDLSIDATDLRILKGAGQRIILAKPVSSAIPNVAWISFDPLEENNVLWMEDFGLYASNSPFRAGTTINKISSSPFPAQDGQYYTFPSDATFHGPNTGSDSPPLGSFRVFNEMPMTFYPALLFGLTQSALVNGGIRAEILPLNASQVPANQSVTFTPQTTVYVWLQANLVSGSVLADLASKSTRIVFGGGKTTASLKYDPLRGMFVPAVASDARSLSAGADPGVYLLERPI